MSFKITNQRYIYEKSIRTVSGKITHLIHCKVSYPIYNGASDEVRNQVWDQVETRISDLTRDVRNLIERRLKVFGNI